MLSSETNGWRREIIGVDARSGSNPATKLTGHYARREAIVVVSCWPALKLWRSFLVACTKVKIEKSLIGFAVQRRALVLVMARA